MLAPAQEVRTLLARAAAGAYDVAYMNEDCHCCYYNLAAAWITPKAANAFLQASHKCPTHGQYRDVDHHTSFLCMDKRLRCMQAPRRHMCRDGSQQRVFGFGLFAQDRTSIQPYLHTLNNSRVRGARDGKVGYQLR